MQPPNPNMPSLPPPTGGLDQRFASYCGACPKLEKGSPESQLTGWGWNRTKKLSQSVDLWSPGGGPDLRELLYSPPVSCSQAESHLALTPALTPRTRTPRTRTPRTLTPRTLTPRTLTELSLPASLIAQHRNQAARPAAGATHRKARGLYQRLPGWRLQESSVLWHTVAWMVL